MMETNYDEAVMLVICSDGVTHYGEAAIYIEAAMWATIYGETAVGGGEMVMTIHGSNSDGKYDGEKRTVLAV